MNNPALDQGSSSPFVHCIVSAQAKRAFAMHVMSAFCLMLSAAKAVVSYLQAVAFPSQVNLSLCPANPFARPDYQAQKDTSTARLAESPCLYLQDPLRHSQNRQTQALTQLGQRQQLCCGRCTALCSGSSKTKAWRGTRRMPARASPAQQSCSALTAAGQSPGLPKLHRQSWQLRLPKLLQPQR